MRGPNVFPGYWRKPGATEVALHNGWLHTGDIAERDVDGFHRIRDRLKDMYITSGENIYPAEVESALYEHPLVRTSRSSACPTPGGVRRGWRRLCCAGVRRLGPPNSSPIAVSDSAGQGAQRSALRRRPAEVGRRQGTQNRATPAWVFTGRRTRREGRAGTAYRTRHPDSPATAGGGRGGVLRPSVTTRRQS